MNRDEVLTLVREHLAEELEVEIGKISEQQATRIHTVGDAVGFVVEHAPA